KQSVNLMTLRFSLTKREDCTGRTPSVTTRHRLAGDGNPHWRQLFESVFVNKRIPFRCLIL
ncbi:MAG: hypothetical protein LBF05_07430, partial [Tannerella sp.]|nr:hypothetical protein [Tannerella sp.]